MQQYEENSTCSRSTRNANDSSFCSVRVNVSGPDPKKLLKGWCTKCCKPSFYKCKRCGDFYCSPKCQKRDWRGHRYLCFPMPSLVYAESCESFDNVPKPMYDNGNNQKSDAPASRGSFEIGSVCSKSSDQTGASFKNLAQASPSRLPYPKYGSAKPMDDDDNNQKSDAPASRGSFEIGSVCSKSSDQTGASFKNLAQASPPSLPYPKYGSAKPMDDDDNNQKSDAPASEESFEIGSVCSKSSDETEASYKSLAQASPPRLPYPKYGSAKPMDDDDNNQKSDAPASRGSFEIGSVCSKSSDQTGASFKNLAQASPPRLPYPKYGSAKPMDDDDNNQKSDAPASRGSFEIGSVCSKSSDQTGASYKNLAQASPPSLPYPKYGSAKPMDDDDNNQKSDAPASEESFEIGSVCSKSSDETEASYKSLAQASPPRLPYPKYGSAKPMDDDDNNQKSDAPASEESFEIGSVCSKSSDQTGASSKNLAQASPPRLPYPKYGRGSFYFG